MLATDDFMRFIEQYDHPQDDASLDRLVGYAMTWADFTAIYGDNTEEHYEDLD